MKTFFSQFGSLWGKVVYTLLDKDGSMQLLFLIVRKRNK